MEITINRTAFEKNASIVIALKAYDQHGQPSPLSNIERFLNMPPDIIRCIQHPSK